MPLINHQLKKVEDITPWGNGKDGFYMHWFGLTDSYYWIKLSQTELLRYSDEFLKKHSLDNKLPYVDYQFARIHDDFLSIFDKIVTPIPEQVFKHIETLDKFKEYLSALNFWLDESWDETDEQYDLIYLPTREWVYDRRLDSGYLIGAPDIYFFSCYDKVYIRWDCSYKDESGIKMWKETGGEYVLGYKEFIEEIRNSFEQFWYDMDERIEEISTKLPIPNIHIEIEKLIKNHNEQKRAYISCINYSLSNLNKPQIEWDKVEENRRLLLSNSKQQKRNK